jgi:hypothetical protein
VPTKFHEERARVAVLTRYRDPDDPELLAARRRMREEVLADAVAKAVSKAPPTTDALRQRVMDLLTVADEAVVA